MKISFAFPIEAEAVYLRARNVREAYPELTDEQVSRVAEAVVARNLTGADLNTFITEIINEPRGV